MAQWYLLWVCLPARANLQSSGQHWHQPLLQKQPKGTLEGDLLPKKSLSRFPLKMTLHLIFFILSPLTCPHTHTQTHFSLPSLPPFFKTQTVEPHLLHEFPDDFYGEELKFLVCGYVRPEASFPSLDELVTAIHNDIAFARAALEEPEWREFGSSRLEWAKTESAA